MDDGRNWSVADTAEECRKISSNWRGAPFWALNGELEPEEIRRQIRLFKSCGLGGFFLHARTGLRTPYLSEKFFEAIESAVDEAEKCGMQAWLYDEDRYPSGACGGLVTKEPQHRAKGIFLEEVSAQEVKNYQFPERLIALFTAVIEGDSAYRVKRIFPEQAAKISPDETLLVFYADTIACSPWYNGYTYLDTLSKESVRHFINLTHETYKARLGEKFGKVIPGIFTDEPRYGFLINQPEWDTESRFALPWTERLNEDFFKHFNYDFTDHLVEYFFDIPEMDSSLCRWHYIETLTRHFIEAYAQQCDAWCRNNNLLFTGHVVAEDSLSYQTLCVGSAMRFYEYMGMPGIDLLTEHHRAYQTVKQLSSAAHQFGQTRRLAECYGCTGWDFPLAGFYALGDWMYALGVNFRCQHLALYTMEGEAKRDYPCPVGPHSDSPDEYKRMEDHFARLTPWLSAGEEKRNILVIHAVESAWTLFHRNWRQKRNVQEFDCKFTDLSHKLLAEHLDFDYADEEILSRHGGVLNGNISVGKAQYKVVVVPELLTIRQTTLDLLERFRNQGGEVFFVNHFPERIDCRKVDASFAYPGQIVPFEKLFIPLEKYRTVSFKSDGKNCSSLLYQWRSGKDFDVLFVCNTGHPVNEACGNGASYNEPFVSERTEEYADVEISLRCSGAEEVVELDTSNGRYYACKSELEDGVLKIKTSFSRLKSRLFIALHPAGTLPVETRPESGEKISSVIDATPAVWQAELSDLNCAVIDHFSENPDGESVWALALDDKIRIENNLPVRTNVMVQPWCHQADEKNGKNIDIYARFRCEVVPEGPLFLVMERPDLYMCFINGTLLELNDSGFYLEKAWRKIPLNGKFLRCGENVLQFKTRMDSAHPGLESVFLLGNFGVKSETDRIELTAPVISLVPGDWCMQGLPFYAGKVTYRTRVSLEKNSRGKIRLTGFEGTSAHIAVDGVDAGTLLFAPGEGRLFDLPETFELAVTVSGSRRNLCGPFFNKEKRPAWCGAAQFKEKEVSFRQLIACGLTGNVEILTVEE